MDSQQLQSYIQSSRNSGLSDVVIRNTLIQAGWPAYLVDEAFGSTTATKAVDPHRILKGVLWILSPFIVLIGVIVIELIVHYFIAFGTDQVVTKVVNILAVLAGLVGAILIPVGPIIGIIKLTRH